MDGYLTADAVAHLRHELRTPINQIVGYCEMLLEDLGAPEVEHRRAPLTDALAAARSVTGLIEAGLPSAARTVGSAQVDALYVSVEIPRRRILDAMGVLLGSASPEVSDEFVADVSRVRDAAERLGSVGRTAALSRGAAGATTAGADGDLTWMVASDTLSAPTAAAPASTEAATAPRSAAHILVVDDVQENRDVLERRLKREGHTVSSASSGQDALAEAARQHFDLILLDIMMPGMDGHETLRRLKASPLTHDVTVLMISALDDIGSIARCIEQGAEDFLPKPFDPVILRARINAALDRKQAREREQAFLRDVGVVAGAAAAVERGSYDPAALRDVAQREDELGVLARVFDTMATGIRQREQRLRGHIDRLKEEIAGITDAPVDSAGATLTLEPSAVVAGRYEIERVVGAGGMGVVYVAGDRELGERVALKVLRPELITADERAIDRFRNEIRLARRIAHRNIVRTHDFGRADDTYFVTMEYVAGTTLRAVLDRRGRLGASAVIGIARQLAEALRCAHDEGIVHRDVKPQNILIDPSGTLKVMDFGIARLAQHTSTITQAGVVVGTPIYMAPEQLLDEDLDARSDLYATGVVLYECLTGRVPYEARSPIALIGKILQGGAATPESVVEGIAPAVSSVVMQLLARDRDQRVESAATLGEMLGGLG